jgi:type II secretory pathway component PulC
MLASVRPRVALGAALLLSASACGGGHVYPEAPPKPAASSAASIPEGSVARADVVQVVDRGLGHFLQQARVEPSLDEERFVGFRVVELVGASFLGKADVRPGDVVTHLNGTFVEDPNQVYEAFEGLREAAAMAAIEGRLLREGQPRTIRFPIVGPKVSRPPADGT